MITVPIAAVIISALGLLITMIGGFIRVHLIINTNSNRIDVIEKKDIAQDIKITKVEDKVNNEYANIQKELSQVNIALARLDTKLDYLERDDKKPNNPTK